MPIQAPVGTNDTANSLNVLKRLFASGGGGGADLELRGRQQARAGELEDQIGRYSNDRTGDPASAAALLKKGLFLKGLERDMATDPYMGDAAHAQVAQADARNAELDAQMDPREKAIHDQAFAEKYAMATGPAEVAGRYGVEAAREKATAQADAMQSLIGMGGADGRSVSVSGVGSIGAEPRAPRPPVVPGTVNNAYKSATQALQTARQGGVVNTMRSWLGMQPSGGAAQDAFNVARRNKIMYELRDPALVDAVERASQHFHSGMSLQDKLSILDQTEDIQTDEDGYAALQRALLEY